MGTGFPQVEAAKLNAAEPGGGQGGEPHKGHLDTESLGTNPKHLLYLGVVDNYADVYDFAIFCSVFGRVRSRFLGVEGVKPKAGEARRGPSKGHLDPKIVT